MMYMHCVVFSHDNITNETFNFHPDKSQLMTVCAIILAGEINATYFFITIKKIIYL